MIQLNRHRLLEELALIARLQRFSCRSGWVRARRTAPGICGSWPDDPRWRDAAGMCRSLTWLTAEELSELNEQISDMFTRYCERTEPDDRPPGARPVRLMAWGISAGPQAGQPDA